MIGSLRAVFFDGLVKMCKKSTEIYGKMCKNNTKKLGKMCKIDIEKLGKMC